MLRLFNKKAQSTLEYAILIGVVVAALIATQVYLKRGYQGKLRESADSAGEQFSPGYTTYDYTTTATTVSNETVIDGESRTDITQQTTNRHGNESVEEASQEYWPGK